MKLSADDCNYFVEDDVVHSCYYYSSGTLIFYLECTSFGFDAEEFDADVADVENTNPSRVT